MDEHQEICMNCFSPLAPGEDNCPACGWRCGEEQRKNALPFGTGLGQRYSVGRVFRANGAGFTYAAFDSVSNRRVNIKEFYPNTIAYRDPNGRTVRPISGAELKFDDYYSEFERYTQKLVRISGVKRLPVLLDTFSENNVQYIVFEHIEGAPLRSYIETNGLLNWETCERMFFPIIHSLGTIHGQNVEHLGISPDTLIITPDDKMMLIGFEMQSVRRAGTDLIEDIYPGCWAIEQYSKTLVCDEVTDVYGLCASMLFALSGTVPAEAPRRKQDPRLLISKSILRGLPEHVVPALANGLQVDADRRTSSFSRLSAELSAEPTVMAKIVETEAVRSIPTAGKHGPNAHGLPPFLWLLISFVVTVAGILLVSAVWFKDMPFSPQSLVSALTAPTPAPVISISMPDIVGEDYDEVEALTQSNSKYNFSLHISDEKFSDTAPARAILSQTPIAGSSVRSGSTVRVTLSRGPSRRVLPDVDGLSYEDAAAALSAEGFAPVQVLEVSDSVAEGNVIAYRDHIAGDELAYGSVIAVRVSGTPEENE